MNTKRKDNKGRLLRDGESQRKDGRYEYKYRDLNGKRHSIYSMKLVDNDTCNGSESLRSMEKRIQKDLLDGIDSSKANNTTLNEMFDDYISTSVNIRGGTLSRYIVSYNKYVRCSIGSKNINCIKYSDIKRMYINMIEQYGISVGYVNVINNILHPIFNVAVRDELIRSNPTTGVMAEIKKKYNFEQPHKNALTQSQQIKLLDFVSNDINDRFIRNLIVVMLGTGIRIGELCALTISDCDFDRGIIDINKTVSRYQVNGKGKRVLKINPPKTKAGRRSIPMIGSVRTALIDQIEYASTMPATFIDGESGFIFTRRKGRPADSCSINRVIDNIVKSYNEKEIKDAADNNRIPELMPYVTSHILRHSFCVRMFELGMDMKVIQSVMGHSNIGVTMDVYTEVTESHMKQKFSEILVDNMSCDKLIQRKQHPLNSAIINA